MISNNFPEKKNNLSSALTAFMEDMWLPWEDSLSIIDREFNAENNGKEKLRQDFSKSMSNPDFDWTALAKTTRLLINSEAYSNLEIKHYVQTLLQDYLYPENVLTEEYRAALDVAVEKILQGHTVSDGWMYAYDLWEQLKQQEMFRDLEYYDLWKISFKKLEIEFKTEENKELEIGYLRCIKK